jgi:hypothetical protein
MEKSRVLLTPKDGNNVPAHQHIPTQRTGTLGGPANQAEFACDDGGLQGADDAFVMLLRLRNRLNPITSILTCFQPHTAGHCRRLTSWLEGCEF